MMKFRLNCIHDIVCLGGITMSITIPLDISSPRVALFVEGTADPPSFEDTD